MRSLGPVWMVPPHVTPFKTRLEKLVTRRALTWLSPCIWGDSDGYASIRRFLCQNAVGRLMVDTFWKILGTDAMSLSKFDNHPETAKLKPRGTAADAIYVG